VPTSPAWNGMVTAFRHRMVPVSQSKTHAVLANRVPLRTGHAFRRIWRRLPEHVRRAALHGVFFLSSHRRR
jgi:hypothetical protein